MSRPLGFTQNITSTISQTRRSDDLKSPGFLPSVIANTNLLPIHLSYNEGNTNDSHLSFYTKALLSKVPRFQAFAKNQSTSALNLFYGGFHPLRILARLKTESISTPGIPWNHNTAIAKRFFIAIGT